MLMRYATAYKVSEKRKRIMTYFEQVSERDSIVERLSSAMAGVGGALF
jgi:hypothetical protein